jgi:hypothetical protein
MATRCDRRLLLLQQRQLVFGRGLGEEIIHAGFLGDGGGGQRVVAGDHHRLDAHGAEALEAIGQAALDDVLQIDHAQRLLRGGDDQRRAAGRLIFSTA